MPSTKELRARIKSVSNTAKVTGAMQLIAASKMRRAQQNVLMGKKYAETIQSLLSNLSSSVDLEKVNIPLLENREVNNKLMILITPDRGLAGALVGNINRKAIEVIQSSEEKYSILSVGRKGYRFLNSRDQEIVDQLEIPDKPEMSDTLKVSDAGKIVLNPCDNLCIKVIASATSALEVFISSNDSIFNSISPISC